MNDVVEAVSNSPSFDWAEFGVVAVVLGAVCWFVVFMHKEHGKERGEWRKDAIAANDKMEAAVKELTTAVRDLISRGPGK